MDNFIYHIPTKIYFGHGQIAHLSEAVRQYGRRVLLVYGGGSIKRSGLYDTITAQFTQEGIEWVELPGVEPNPRITSVREGVRLCREHDVEVVVPVGGGSTIDCAKLIAAGYYYGGDPWELVLDWTKIECALPIVTVLTLAATGSEMDAGGVITNLETDEKKAAIHPHMLPKASILDPTYTCSVSPYQTAAGTADIMSHILEGYFSNTVGFFQDRIAEALLKTCVRYGVQAVGHPDDYEARANLMWTSSWAINGLTSLGKEVGWSVHSMEHQLSACYDLTHGVGLAILTPHWMRHVLDENSVDRFVQYAAEIWNVPRVGDRYKIAEEGIRRTAAYFEKMGIPMTLREAGIPDDSKFAAMAQKAAEEIEGAYRPLTAADVEAIYRAAF